MAKKLSGKVGYADPFYDFSGPMFNLYPTAREETDVERITRLNNREITMRDAPPFTPDMEDQNYLRVASKASALGIPMPAPIGPNNTYTLQQAADFIAANPMPNRLGEQVLSPQEALALRIRQAQAARMIPGSVDILSPRSFSPSMQDATFAGGRDYANPQGPYDPTPGGFGGNMNALARDVGGLFGMPDFNFNKENFREAAYPYLQMLGLAVGERRR